MSGEKRQIFAVFFFVVVLFAAVSAQAASIPSKEDLLFVVPGASTFQHEIRPLDIYIMMDEDGERVGTAFVTSRISPEVAGYGGEIDILVGIDKEGGITGTKILGHNETSEYIDRMISPGFLDAFKGRNHDASFDDIEAISGATISSQAIVDDVKGAVRTVMSQFEEDEKVFAESRGFMIGSAAGPVTAILLLALAVIANLMPARRYLRIISLALSVPVIGFWLNTSITIGSLVDIRNLHFSWSAMLPLTILIIFAIGACLFKGNLYCSYLCPFGALQMGAAALKLPKIHPGERLEKAMRLLRWLITIIAIYAIAGLGSMAFRLLEPFSTCFSLAPDRMALIQTATVLVAALFVHRVWCRFFCPTGLILEIIALLGAKVRFKLKTLFVRCREK